MVVAGCVVRPPTYSYREPVNFRSPSGNIACYLDTSHVRCDIMERNWSAPPPPACEYDWGGSLGSDSYGWPESLCISDTVFGGQSLVLGYGQSVQEGLLRCDSATSGVTCTDVRTGRGFSMSRESYSLFS